MPMYFTNGNDPHDVHADFLNRCGKNAKREIKACLEGACNYTGNPSAQSVAGVAITVAHKGMRRALANAWDDFVAAVEKAKIDVKRLDAGKEFLD